MRYAIAWHVESALGRFFRIYSRDAAAQQTWFDGMQPSYRAVFYHSGMQALLCTRAAVGIDRCETHALTQNTPLGFPSGVFAFEA